MMLLFYHSSSAQQTNSKQMDTLNNQIILITTMQIKEGNLEKVKEALKKSVEFAKEKGPQLMVQVFVDDKKMQINSIQLHRNSESIIDHWKLSDAYIEGVMQYITMKRVDVYGLPNKIIIQRLDKLAENGCVVSVMPFFTGYSHLLEK